MVKRMFSTSTGSKPNNGGECTKCKVNNGVTLKVDEFSSYCLSCHIELSCPKSQCLVVSKKGAIKLIDTVHLQRVERGKKTCQNRIKTKSGLYLSYCVEADVRGYRIYPE